MDREKIKSFLAEKIKNINPKSFYGIIKYKHSDIYEWIINTTKYLLSNVSFNERIYNIMNDIHNPIKCERIGCDNIVKFDRYTKGYFRHCSIYCSRNDEIVKNKFKNTYLEKTGYNHPSENPEIKEKKKQTFIENWGTDNPNKSEIIKEKIRKTNFEKYGVSNPLLIKEIYDRTAYKRKIIFLKNLDKMLDYLNLKLLDENYINNLFDHKWKCLKCGNIFIHKWDYIKQGYGCPNCNTNNTSREEKELLDFIESLNFTAIGNSREIIDPQELNIYIPSENIAIEFNGLYWHSGKCGKNETYHLNKLEKCSSKNIKLIHIFEDEWIFKQEIVKSMLKQILNININLLKIYARKCEIKEINSKTKNKFLNKYHLQGEDRSNVKLGAFYNDELISIMTFSHGSISRKKLSENSWELSRFCSNYNYHIPGIASKLLTYFKRNYEWKEIFSYADRRWSNGNLYYKLGFKLDHITKPNYWYVKGLERVHRFNLRKKYNEPKNIPEWILRSKEGYHRIWDCGHYKFVMRDEING